MLVAIGAALSLAAFAVEEISEPAETPPGSSRSPRPRS
jgi:hypothetical protein